VPGQCIVSRARIVRKVEQADELRELTREQRSQPAPDEDDASMLKTPLEQAQLLHGRRMRAVLEAVSTQVDGYAELPEDTDEISRNLLSELDEAAN
jgi:hypothetical protein